MSFTEEIIIKKYQNRRLYNTNTSSYINFADVYNLVISNVNFKIVDMQGCDITQVILIQVILEQQSKGPATLPISFLRQIILLYNFQSNKNNPEVMDNVTVFLEKQRAVIENFLEMHNKEDQAKSRDLNNTNHINIFKNAFNYFAKGK